MNKDIISKLLNSSLYEDNLIGLNLLRDSTFEECIETFPEAKFHESPINVMGIKVIRKNSIENMSFNYEQYKINSGLYVSLHRAMFYIYPKFAWRQGIVNFKDL